MVKSLGVGRFMDWRVVDVGGVLGGILVFWDNRILELLELERGVYTILGHFRNVEDDYIWVFIGVYGPVLSKAKEEFWEELGAIKGLLKQVVGEVVSEYQYAFIQNTQILDVALIANKAVDSRLKVNIPGLLLKLDIEKAFDHVN
eukprot:XP_010644033.1 PREDICTED: uncharacterized protein LOC104877467 [Vitis vinifera]